MSVNKFSDIVENSCQIRRERVILAAVIPSETRHPAQWIKAQMRIPRPCLDFGMAKQLADARQGQAGVDGFIAPTDEEFIVVDADDDRFPPSCQIILSVNARRKNQRPGLSWRHRTAEIVSRLRLQILRRWPN
jgi:hypothetical protein